MKQNMAAMGKINTEHFLHILLHFKSIEQNFDETGQNLRTSKQGILHTSTGDKFSIRATLRRYTEMSITISTWYSGLKYTRYKPHCWIIANKDPKAKCILSNAVAQSAYTVFFQVASHCLYQS